jgi:hypothetical protein
MDKKNIQKKNVDVSDSDSDSDYSSSEDEQEIRKKMIPAAVRLREAIKAKKDDRKKNTKKYKDNFDE